MKVFGLMHRGMTRYRASRFLAVLFLGALVLIPLLERGHGHADLERGRPCTACVLACHSPAASVPVVTVATPVLHQMGVALVPYAAPARSCQFSHSGRAPPFSAFTAGA